MIYKPGDQTAFGLVARLMNVHSGRSGMWSRFGGVLAYAHDWQRPAKTEEWAYESALPLMEGAKFSQLICFPWATLIDLQRKGRPDKAARLLAMLNAVPPRSTLVRATVCQHIFMADMLPHFSRLGITDIFWPHACIGETEMSGIRIHPFPLFPVRCQDLQGALAESDKAPRQRRYLYSFMGAHDQRGYLTAVREWIMALPPRDDALLVRRPQWHYEAKVYGEQVADRSLSGEELAAHDTERQEYLDSMTESVFALCPSGSGPNSIRLWEALGFGCIPVLLADTLRLPGDDAEWDHAILRVRETSEEVRRLPETLANLAGDQPRLEAMRIAGRKLWEKYGLRGPATCLGVLADRDWIRKHQPRSNGIAYRSGE